MSEAPKRAFTIRIEVGGDTLEDAVLLAKHFIDLAGNGCPGCVSGGCSSGGVLSVRERDDLTPEQFADELNRYLSETSQGAK